MDSIKITSLPVSFHIGDKLIVIDKEDYSYQGIVGDIRANEKDSSNPFIILIQVNGGEYCFWLKDIKSLTQI